MQKLLQYMYLLNVCGIATYLKIINWVTSSQLVPEDPTHLVYLGGHFCEAVF